MALADCADLTKRLFGFEIGGPRSYVDRLPTGLSLFPERREMLTAGVDAISGKSQQMDFRSVQIFWHGNRVVRVMAIIQGSSGADIDAAHGRVMQLAGVGFYPKSIPPNQFLHCSDGLIARVVRSQQVRSKDDVVPLLILSVENPKLMAAMKESISVPREEQEQDLIAAAESGDTRAQVILGNNYLSRNDRPRGIPWLRRAADAGSVEGQYKLGLALGIFKDPESWTWLERAAVQGHEEAFSYVMRVVGFHRICEAPEGRYVAFLRAVAATNHEKIRKMAQNLLPSAVSQDSRC